MRSNRSRRRAAWLAASSAGMLWLFGCTTATQFRDFGQSTLVRVFWQSVGTALQSAIIDQFGSRDEG